MRVVRVLNFVLMVLLLLAWGVFLYAGLLALVLNVAHWMGWLWW